jgi:leucine dehydrogenase
MGMKACAKQVYGSDSLSGKKVVVQGIGHVGENLVKHLSEEGARVTIFDISKDRMASVAAKYQAQVFNGDDLYSLDMDIYAPCALGATVNSETISKLKCSIIAGAANNQLEDENVHGHEVMQKGIVYAPDFLINAGGLINVYSELHGYNRAMAMGQAEKIYYTTLDILKKSAEANIPTINAAKEIAEKRIREIGTIKLSR